MVKYRKICIFLKYVYFPEKIRIFPNGNFPMTQPTINKMHVECWQCQAQLVFSMIYDLPITFFKIATLHTSKWQWQMAIHRPPSPHNYIHLISFILCQDFFPVGWEIDFSQKLLFFGISRCYAVNSLKLTCPTC